MFNIILLGLTSLFTDISSEMIYPLLPLYLTTQLGATPAILGLIEGFVESLASILKVYSGRLSDKFSRRKPLTIAGYSLSALGKLSLYLSTSYLHVFFSRVFDRFGKGVRTAPRDALIADSAKTDEKGKAFGLHRMLDTIGATIGVLISYYFFVTMANAPSGSVFKTVFLLSIIPAALGVIILFFTREKTAEKAAATAETRKNAVPLKSLIIPRKLKIFLVISFIFALGNSSNQFLLLRAGNMGFKAAEVILLYFAFNIISSLVSLPSGKMSDRIGRKKVLIAGYLLYGLSYLGFGLAGSRAWLLPLFLVYGIYTGLTEGVEKAFVSDLAPQDNRATFLGLHATIVGIGLLPASIITGLLWNFFGPSIPFYFGAFTGLFASLLFIFMI